MFDVKKVTGLFVFLLFGFVNLAAQVQYKIELLPDNVTYQVSLIPSIDWSGAEAITSTAQLTLVVPTGGFEITHLKSLNGHWENNANIKTPIENPTYDYLSIGLVALGTSEITYQAGVETVLFTFVNQGNCTGNVTLMNSDDPFFAPNSVNVNVGNQLTTFGSGNVNAWVGNTSNNVDCGNTVISNR